MSAFPIWRVAGNPAILGAPAASGPGGVGSPIGLLLSLTFTSFTPTAISGLKLWFDASDSGSITQSGGAVSQWNDKSGNNNHATQATAGNKPSLQTAAQNGLNTILFASASSKFMSLTSTVNVASAHTIIYVAKRVSGSASVFGGTGGASPIYCGLHFNDTKYYVGTAAQQYGSTTVSSTSHNQISMNTTPEIYLNGSALTTSAGGVGQDAILTQVGNGAGFYSDIEIAEVLLYDSVLSAGNRQLAEAYLKAKWATP